MVYARFFLGGFGLGIFVFWITLTIMGGGYDDDN